MTAKQLAQFVIDNGRVEGEGAAWLESLRVEVEFEARERGLENSEELAEEAVENPKSEEQLAIEQAKAAAHARWEADLPKMLEDEAFAREY